MGTSLDTGDGSGQVILGLQRSPPSVDHHWRAAGVRLLRTPGPAAPARTALKFAMGTGLDTGDGSGQVISGLLRSPPSVDHHWRAARVWLLRTLDVG